LTEQAWAVSRVLGFGSWSRKAAEEELLLWGERDLLRTIGCRSICRPPRPGRAAQ